MIETVFWNKKIDTKQKKIRKMKLFVVLTCIAMAVAKPQGYAYNEPSAVGN